MADRWFWAYQSVGYAKQTDLNTENSTDGDFAYFPAEVGMPELTRQMFNLAIATGQVGAKYAPVAGSKRAKVTIKSPLWGFKKQYDPESMEPGVTANVLSAIKVLLGLMLGSNSESGSISTAADLAKGLGLSICDFTSSFTATYANNEVAAVPTTLTMDVQAGHGSRFKAGQFIAGDTTKTAGSPFMTWIKSISTDTLTMADAAGNQPQVNDDIWASVVAYVSGQQPLPITIRLMGNNAAFKVALVGCIPTALKFTGKAGEPPMVEITFEAVSYLTYGTGGGLQALTMNPQNPVPCVGVGGGRFTFAAYASAMAAVDGVRDFSVEVTNKVSDFQSVNKASGICERRVADREIKVKWLHPRSSSDTIASGEGPWDTALLNSSGYHAAMYWGDLPGRLASVFLPVIYLQEAKPTVVDGAVYDELTWSPGAYSSDGASTNAGNSVLRFGFA